MQLTQWTLFIDMLGYRDINGSINNEEKAKEFIEFMDENKKIFEYSDSDEVKERYNKDASFNLYKYYEIQKTFVSDSLIITYSPKLVDEPERPGLADMHSANALFIISMRLQTFIFHCFAEKGIFLRGGISNKYCHIKDSFAVGEGLIEAYLAESKLAINPRIILHPEVTQNLPIMEKINFLADRMYSGKSIIEKDIDGLYFIDHVGYAIATIDLSIPMVAMAETKNPLQYISNKESITTYVQRHSEAINRKLNELSGSLSQAAPGSVAAEKIKSVISKFEWLRRYHNSKIEGHKFLREYISN